MNPYLEMNLDPQAFPLGILSIASMAKDAGYTIYFEDRALKASNIKKTFNKFMPDILAVSLVSIKGLRDAKYISKYAKDRGLITVWGGPFATMASEAILRDGFADIVCVGEGEGTFIELLEKLEKSEPYFDIKGIAFIKNGIYIRNPDRDFIPGEELPIIDFSLIPAKKYLHPYHNCIKMGFLYSSKGCNGQCTFCFNKDFHHSTYRKRPIENVLSEISYLAKTSGLDGVFFADELWCTNKADVLRNCKAIIDSGLQFVWGCMIRFGMLDRSDYEYMYQSGCRWLYFGIESGSPERLKKIKKMSTLCCLNSI